MIKKTVMTMMVAGSLAMSAFAGNEGVWQNGQFLSVDRQTYIISRIGTSVSINTIGPRSVPNLTPEQAAAYLNSTAEGRAASAKFDADLKAAGAKFDRDLKALENGADITTFIR